nr:hypothetical protein [Candidatus Sigynarchaeota archaeon]
MRSTVQTTFLALLTVSVIWCCAPGAAIVTNPVCHGNWRLCGTCDDGNDRKEAWFQLMSAGQYITVLANFSAQMYDLRLELYTSANVQLTYNHTSYSTAVSLNFTLPNHEIFYLDLKGRISGSEWTVDTDFDVQVIGTVESFGSTTGWWPLYPFMPYIILGIVTVATIIAIVYLIRYSARKKRDRLPKTDYDDREEQGERETSYAP